MKIKDLMFNYIESHYADLAKMEKLSTFVHDYFKAIKEEHPDLYHEFKEELDDFTFEIDHDIIEKAISHLHRKDGKEGKKWEMEDTSAVAKQYGIFTKHPGISEMIWYFALNYTYAVHYRQDRTIAEFVELTCEEIADKNICIESKIKHLYNK